MNELKIKSRYNVILFVFVLFFLVRMKTVSTKYLQDTTEITGVVLSITEKENRTTLVVKAKEKILVSLKVTEDIQLGDKVTIKGTLEKPKGATNFHLFSYKNYLLSKKIFWVMNGEGIIIQKKNKNVFYTIKNGIRKRIDKLDRKEYYSAFLLGDTSGIESKVKTSYQKNGVSHLFAISGMHITFLSMMLLSALKKHFSFKTSIFLLFPFFLFYLFLTDFSPSVIRACFLFFACSMKKIYSFSFSSKDVLIFLFFFLLCINPYYFYHTGFLFSFTISFFLLHFQTLCNQNTKLKSLFMTSFLAFLAGFPIQLYQFFECNFLSPILNLIFVPFVSTIVFPFSFLAFFFPILDVIFSFMVLLLEKVSLFLSTITIGHISFGYHPVFLLLTTILIFYSFTKLKEKKIHGFLLLGICLLFYYNMNFFNPNTTVTFLDVGQGDSILISLKHNKGNILIDTGGALMKEGEILEQTLLPVLKSRGIHSLDALILTHGGV